MASWNYSRTALFFDENANDEKLIRQVMECFDYEETDFLYMDETGVEGPKLKDFDNPTLCYEGSDELVSEGLFYLLNTLCKNVAVYSVTAEGSSVSDYYSGEEHTYDPVTGKHFRREFNYCYGEGTAFDEYVESEDEDLSEAGTRCEEQTIDVNDFSGIYDSFTLLDMSLGDAEEGNFSELYDVIAKKKKELADSGKTYAKINGNVLERAMTFGEGFIIPGSVKRIGYGAFDNCKTLSRIIIPEGVESIGSNAFSGCSKLVEVTLPDSIISIGKDAFEGTAWFDNCSEEEKQAILDKKVQCAKSGDVVIPDNVTFIDDNMFKDCDEITSIIIPDGVTGIGSGAFSGCTRLKSISIPDSVTSIGEGAFYDCASLTKITLPSKITCIDGLTFMGCTSLEKITLPPSITSIEFEAFSGCQSLTNITIPDSVTVIDDCVFEGCVNLTSITIPASVKEIGEYAFDDCDDLTITAPVGSYAIEYAEEHDIEYIETEGDDYNEDDE